MVESGINTHKVRTAFLNVRSDELRRRIFEAVSFNLAHEAIWHTKTVTLDDALEAHRYRLQEFDQALRQEQAAQFILIASQLKQQEYIDAMQRFLKRYSKPV